MVVEGRTGTKLWYYPFVHRPSVTSVQAGHSAVHILAQDTATACMNTQHTYAHMIAHTVAMQASPSLSVPTSLEERQG